MFSEVFCKDGTHIEKGFVGQINEIKFCIPVLGACLRIVWNGASFWLLLHGWLRATKFISKYYGLRMGKLSLVSISGF